MWQLRFALSSSSVFCRTDTSTDSERFYGTVLDFLDDPDEKDNVDELLDWWNWYVCPWLQDILSKLTLSYLDSHVFPSHVRHERAINKTSALAKLKEKRAALRQRNATAA